MKSNNPTTMIKCRFSNLIHKVMSENKELLRDISYGINKPENDKKKNELLNQIVKIYNESNGELRNWFSKKKDKKETHKVRVKNGYYEKKKDKKERSKLYKLEVK